MSDTCYNFAEIAGIAADDPTFSHELFGEGLYSFTIAVNRLSGINDMISVTISDRLCDISGIKAGVYLRIKGEYRSYNIKTGTDMKVRLILSLFVKDIIFPDSPCEYMNFITLTGYICKPVMFRQTPQKREIADILVAVNRRFKKSDYIPCISWGRNAKFASSLKVGTLIGITGRIQSRQYTKIDESFTETTYTAFEISISKIEIIV